MKSSAKFSDCRKYRYSLWREWDASKGYVMFIGLNPSTADETLDDPTIRRCMAFARAWGYGALCMTNLFAYRSTDPYEMQEIAFPIGADNNMVLLELAADAAIVVAAWGVHGTHRGRNEEVKRIIPCLHYLRLTKDNHPGHPLYLPGNLVPVPWVSKSIPHLPQLLR